jgi:hypothetical protein
MGSITSKVDNKNQVTEIEHSDKTFDKALLNKYKDLVNSKGIIIVKINVDKLINYYKRFHDKIKASEKFTNIEAFGDQFNIIDFAQLIERETVKYFQEIKATYPPKMERHINPNYETILSSIRYIQKLTGSQTKMITESKNIIKSTVNNLIETNTNTNTKELLKKILEDYLELIFKVIKTQEEGINLINVDTLSKSHISEPIKTMINIPPPDQLEMQGLLMVGMGSMSGFYTILKEQEQSKQKVSYVKIVLPRILLENDQSFITFLLSEFNKNIKNEGFDLLNKLIKSVLSGLNKNTKNKEVRMANSINLILNLAIIGGVLSFIGDRNPKLVIEIFAEFSEDFFSMMPDTKCYFIKDNYIEFDPDICKEAEKKLECPKQECPVPSCPKAELSCPKAEVSCPACPIPKIPECPKTDLTGTNDLIQSNKLFSYLNTFLVLVLICLIGYYIFVKSNTT